MIELRTIRKDEIPLISAWLMQDENCRWLDFGNGIQTLSPALLQIMASRETHAMRVFTCGRGDEPVGLIAFGSVDRRVRTANLWYVLGDKRFKGQGLTTRAVSEMLGLGFGELPLESVNAWVVEGNVSSIRILERNGFQYIGRQRRCHYIGDRARDRLSSRAKRPDSSRRFVVKWSKRAGRSWKPPITRSAGR
jgi:RimJ/RimL family protein N-acetyltransferase